MTYQQKIDQLGKRIRMGVCLTVVAGVSFGILLIRYYKKRQ